MVRVHVSLEHEPNRPPLLAGERKINVPRQGRINHRGVARRADDGREAAFAGLADLNDLDRCIANEYSSGIPGQTPRFIPPASDRTSKPRSASSGPLSG
jgi:hypothetical protein